MYSIKFVSRKFCSRYVVFILSVLSEFLSGFPLLYQNKLQKGGVQDVVNINKIKFESYGDLVHQAFLEVNEILINNQHPHYQIKNY